MAREPTGQVTQKTDKKTGKAYWVARWKTAEVGADGKRKVGQQKCKTKTEARRVAYANTLQAQTEMATISTETAQERLEEYRDRTHGWAEPFGDIAAQYERALAAGYNGAAPLKASTLNGYMKHHRFFQTIFETKGGNWTSIAGKDMRDALLIAVDKKKFVRKTAKAKFDQLSRVCRYAVAEGLASYDPTAGLEIKLATAEEKVRAKAIKREAAYRPDEIKAMLAAADSLTTEAPDMRARRSWVNVYRPLLHVLIQTGCRYGEVRALRRCDIDAAKNSIHIETAADYKNDIDTPKSANAVRTIKVTPECMEYIKFALSRHNHSLVFASRDGNPRSDNVFRKHMLAPLVKKAGVPHRGFHGFRHHFASAHIAAGTQVLKLSKMLGHHAPSFTMDVYAHFFEELEDAPVLDLTA